MPRYGVATLQHILQNQSLAKCASGYAEYSSSIYLLFFIVIVSIFVFRIILYKTWGQLIPFRAPSPLTIGERVARNRRKQFLTGAKIRIFLSSEGLLSVHTYGRSSCVHCLLSFAEMGLIQSTGQCIIEPWTLCVCDRSAVKDGMGCQPTASTLCRLHTAKIRIIKKNWTIHVQV
jgi:hypothetical protein